MQLAVKILDKTTDGKLYQESSLKLVSERTTLREILEKRIQQEVDKHNSSDLKPTSMQIIEINELRLKSRSM